MELSFGRYVPSVSEASYRTPVKFNVYLLLTVYSICFMCLYALLLCQV